MHRQKGTPNIPQKIVHEIIDRHRSGETVRELMDVYGKPNYTIRNIIKRENKKSRTTVSSKKFRGRKPAVILQEYKYENKRQKMKNGCESRYNYHFPLKVQKQPGIAKST